MSREYIIGAFASLTSAVTAILIAVGMNLVQVNAGNHHGNSEEEFQQRATINQLVIALKESLPVYATSILKSSKLSSEQRKTLELLYMPVISDFAATGDVSLIEKAATIKRLVLENKISAFTK